MKKPSLMFNLLLTTILSFSFLVQTAAFSQGGAKVTNSPPTDNASYLSQSTPGIMAPGQTYDVSISMKNSGTSVWQKDNYKLKLMNPTEALIKLWGISQIDLGSTINPGESVTFTFKMKAPETVGDYNMQWQMANGNAFFGEPTANIPVTVVSAEVPPAPKNDVNYNSTHKYNNIPAEIETNGGYDIVITMRNTGATDWNPSEDMLRITASAINDTKNPWQVQTVNLPQPVVTGGEYSFQFKLTGPPESGEYTLQAQMVHKDVPFGEPSPNVQVKVK